MNRSLTATTIGLLIAITSACGSDSEASVDTSQATPTNPTSEPPDTEPPDTEPPDTEPPDTEVPVTEVPETVPTTEPAPESTAAPTTAPPAPVTTAVPDPTVNAAACLVGDWVVSDAELAEYHDVVASNSAFESIDSTGEIRLSVTDTTIEWTNDYSSSMTIDDVTYESTSTGSVSGTYTASDGVITGTVVEEGRMGTVTQDGRPIVGDVGDLFAGIHLGRPIDTILFSCDGPTLDLEAGPMEGARHTVTLTPG